MFLFNAAAGRELQEGDEVTALTGPRRGKTGIVVGFDVYNDRPVVLQFREKGLEPFAANEVKIRTCKAPTALEPLPVIRRILSEAHTLRHRKTRATVRVGRTTLTLVPRRNWDLRQIAESEDHQPLERRLDEVLKHSFVTRLPHLIER